MKWSSAFSSFALMYVIILVLWLLSSVFKTLSSTIFLLNSPDQCVIIHHKLCINKLPLCFGNRLISYPNWSIRQNNPTFRISPSKVFGPGRFVGVVGFFKFQHLLFSYFYPLRSALTLQGNHLPKITYQKLLGKYEVKLFIA